MPLFPLLLGLLRLLLLPLLLPGPPVGLGVAAVDMPDVVTTDYALTLFLNFVSGVPTGQARCKGRNGSKVRLHHYYSYADVVCLLIESGASDVIPTCPQKPCLL